MAPVKKTKIIMLICACCMVFYSGLCAVNAEGTATVDLQEKSEYTADGIALSVLHGIASGKISVGVTTDEKDDMVSVRVDGANNSLNYIEQLYTDENGYADTEYINSGENGKYTVQIYVQRFDTIFKREIEFLDSLTLDGIYGRAIDAKTDEETASLKNELVTNSKALGIDLELYSRLTDTDEVMPYMLSQLAKQKPADIDDVAEEFQNAVFLAGVHQKIIGIDPLSDTYKRCYALDDVMPVYSDNKDAFTSQSDKIRSSIIEKLAAEKNFENISDFRDKLALYTLTEALSKATLWQSVKPVLTAYSAAGLLDISEQTLKGISDTSKVYIAMMGKPYTTYESVKTEYNAAAKEVLSGASGSGSSGGGGGGGSKGGSAAVSVPVPTKVQQTAVSQQEETLSLSFEDMDNAKWAISAVEDLYKRGVISGGGDGNFKPNDNITRAEIVKIFVSLSGVYSDDAYSTFADVSETDWYFKHAASAQASGLIIGDADRCFRAGEDITRAEAAVLADRTLQTMGVTNVPDRLVRQFTDFDGFADWAKNSIAKCQKFAIINGRDGNRFEPDEKLTRAEAAVIAYKMLKVANK